MENVSKKLSQDDAVHLLELIYLSLSCGSQEELHMLIGKLKFLIPFDFAACGFAEMNTEGKIKSFEMFNISFPAEWFHKYASQKLYEIDPVFKKNFADFSVQYWTDTYKTDNPSVKFLCLKNDFGLGDGCTHGVKSSKKMQGSMFSLSCKSPICRSSKSCNSSSSQRRIETILNQIIPHLHNALCRIAGQSAKRQINPLSPKELEVLNWIKEGKTSWDISTILGISERTVNFHATNVMQKLDAISRPQAIANAISLGLIEVD